MKSVRTYGTRVLVAVLVALGVAVAAAGPAAAYTPCRPYHSVDDQSC